MYLAKNLFSQMYAGGVRHLFGIPGDFALDLFEALEKFNKIKLHTLSHEPALGFAADGLSRYKNQMTAIAFTYGAGGMNAINGVACAYAERSPLVVLSGAPGIIDSQPGLLLHHQTKDLNSQLKAFQEVTSFATRLDDPKEALEKINYALKICQQESRPVYLEIPRDRVYSRVKNRHFKSSIVPVSDSLASEEAVQETLVKLQQAKRPVLMVGLEVHRYRLQKQVVHLAKQLNIPVVSSFMARSTYPIDDDLFSGIYIGSAGDPKVQKLVESSDCLLMLGVMVTDTNMGVRLKSLDAKNIINLYDSKVFVSHHYYENVRLKAFIKSLSEQKLPQFKTLSYRLKNQKTNQHKSFDESAVDVDTIIQVINQSLNYDCKYPVTIDTGDCTFASVDLQARAALAPGYYATMGFAVPAALGIELGSGKRPIVLVGDGAFQMTGQELIHCQRYKLKPIVIVFNNQNWEMLNVLKPGTSHHRLASLDYYKMAELWGGRGYLVETKQQMEVAFDSALKQKKMTLLDVRLQPGNRSRLLQRFLSSVKKS